MALEHDRTSLTGGTTVLTRPIEANDIVAVYITTAMGTLYESDDEAGISNLLQSLLLRGTVQRGAHEFHDRLAELGAEIDSGAGADLGAVTLKATRETWEPALDLMIEAILEPAFDAEELATEKEQTLGLLDAREDQLVTRAFDQYRERFYGDHPYHKPGLGYRASIRAIDRDRIVDAADRFYSGAPPVVVAAGRFDPDRLMARLEAAFSGEPAMRIPDRPPAPVPGSGAALTELDRDAAYLVYGFAAPGFTADEYATGRVVDAVLGGSMSSRLFVELREKRSLAYQVSTVYRDHLDGGYMAGFIVTDPGRVEEAGHGMAWEFRRLIEEPIPDSELEGAQGYLHGRYVLSAESNMAQARRLARYEVLGLGVDFGDRWLERMYEVTVDDCRVFAERWFTGEPTVSWVLPTGTPVPTLLRSSEHR